MLSIPVHVYKTVSPTIVNAGLISAAKKLDLSPKESQLVNERILWLRNRLMGELFIDLVPSGSFSRRTVVTPTYDVDLLVVLDDQELANISTTIFHSLQVQICRGGTTMVVEAS